MNKKKSLEEQLKKRIEPFYSSDVILPIIYEEVDSLVTELRSQIEVLKEEKESLKKLMKDYVDTEFWLINETWIRRCKGIDIQVKTLKQVLAKLRPKEHKKETEG